MNRLAAIVLLLLTATLGCSPNTDITETSTDTASGRAPYSVVERQTPDDQLILRVRVSSPGSAERIARDLVERELMRANTIEVNLVDKEDAPIGKMSWSTDRGFRYENER
jgi:hypothetical protein